MHYLVLTVICSVLLGFIFKLFGRFGINGFQAIVFNYITCFCCGWLHLGHFPWQRELASQPWFPYALGLGLIFVTAFNLAALTVRHFGVTVGQVMQKMSILMSAPFAVMAYQESAGIAKILGILCALASIVLVNWPQRSDPGAQTAGARNLLWIPIATWVLSGLLEVLLVQVQNGGLSQPGDPTFVITIFGTAGLLGLSVMLWGLFSGKFQFAWRNVLAGILLGIPNYGSMLFILLALESNLEASFVFPAANVGIIVVTALGAVMLFRERLSRLNWLGIGLAVAAILLMTSKS